ncbi:MAG: hypothetical protein UZ11_BCD004001981 [Bacteroidetes bacterium OLB11]|mgnify:CR=1 FL=1|nr:MAG: hypothetical protein UZ11_BCD004001981 [Bacteroidetes bacterium OLB11]
MLFERLLKEKGKLLISHRYNFVPLLCSHPGGLEGAGRIRLADANVL